MSDYEYPGEELQIFAEAVRWKAYFKRQMAPYLSGTVAEVGAGLGGTTEILCDGTQARWIALEPDRALFDRLETAVASLAARIEARTGRPAVVEARLGTLANLDAPVDTIVYCDVLEHIENDAGELSRAASKLRPGGRVIVLSPAHQWLYSPFDRAIGHYRRYTVDSLRALQPAGLSPERFWYLDAVGLLASLANRALLSQRMPTRSQIRFWDGVMVPLSRMFDPLTGYRLGKSVVGVWRREPS